MKPLRPVSGPRTGSMAAAGLKEARRAQSSTRGKERLLPRDAFHIVTALLLVVTISRVHQQFGFLSQLRPGLVLLALALLFAAMNPRMLAVANLRTYPIRIVGLLVLAACLSVPFGLSMGNSAKFLLDAYLRLILVYLLITLSLGGTRELRQYTWAFLVAVGILVYQATFHFDLGAGWGGMQRLNDLFMYDSNDLGVILLMGIPLSLVAYETSGRMGKVLSALLLVGIGVAIARSGSRGAFVGLVALGGAFLLWARHIPISRRLGTLVAVVAALSIAAPFGYWEQMRSLASPTQDYNWTSDQGRKATTIRAMKYMLDHPVSGIGVDNFTKAEFEISSLARDRFRQKRISGRVAHNTWLQAGAEMGIPGFILWILLVFGTMRAVARWRRRLPASWKRGSTEQKLLYSLSFQLPLAIWAFAVPSTFVSHVYMDPMYFLAALSAGFLVAVNRERRRSQVPIPRGSGDR